MTNLAAACGTTTPRDRRNQRWILVATAAWAVTFGAATFAIRFEVVPVGPAAWAVAAIPTLVGLWVVLAYRRFLREADELQRTIHLRAFAIALAATFLAITGSPVLVHAGAPPLEAGLAVVVMAAAYSIAFVDGALRYR